MRENHGHSHPDSADDPDGLWDDAEPELAPLPISEAKQISYGEWGEQFFAAAISDDRIRGAVGALAGQPIDFGPMGVGPGRIAKVKARGQIGEALLFRQDGFPVTYDMTIPVDLTFEVDLKLETERFDAHLEVPIRLIGRAVDGVRIYIEARPPHNSEVSVEVKADGRRAEWLRRIAGVDDELRRFVAKYVTRELDKPAIRRAREVDVIPLMDKAWSPNG